MPKGSPNRQTIASEKYQKKAGYMVKSFKLKRDIVEQFEATCEKAGTSQASQITRLMKEYSKKNIEERYIESREPLEELNLAIENAVSALKKIVKNTSDDEIAIKLEYMISDIMGMKKEMKKLFEENHEIYNQAYKKAGCREKDDDEIR